MSISFISATQFKIIAKMAAAQLNTNGRISGLKFKYDKVEINLGLIEISYEGSNLDYSMDVDNEFDGLNMGQSVADAKVSGNPKGSIVVKDLRIVDTSDDDGGVFEMDELEFSGLSETLDFAMQFALKGDL